ncbi:hypothetical protein [Shouchella clausii]|uniref:hypothetical protein n=1 Tax=Shouchella clausii TaxID=79880 RepID=UPI00115503ED|nr:hypothetical protein [Shouchella clausii]
MISAFNWFVGFLCFLFRKAPVLDLVACNDVFDWFGVSVKVGAGFADSGCFDVLYPICLY